MQKEIPFPSPWKPLIMVRPFRYLDLKKFKGQESRIKPGLKNGENKNRIILGRSDYFAKLTFHK